MIKLLSSSVPRAKFGVTSAQVSDRNLGSTRVAFSSGGVSMDAKARFGKMKRQLGSVHDYPACGEMNLTQSIKHMNDLVSP